MEIERYPVKTFYRCSETCAFVNKVLRDAGRTRFYDESECAKQWTSNPTKELIVGYDGRVPVGYCVIQTLVSSVDLYHEILKSINPEFDNGVGDELSAAIRNEECIYLGSFTVAGDKRGLGYGRRIYDKILKPENLPKNIKWVVLYVSRHNILALNLNMSLGFRICGWWPGSRENQNDDYLLYFKL